MTTPNPKSHQTAQNLEQRPQDHPLTEAKPFKWFWFPEFQILKSGMVSVKLSEILGGVNRLPLDPSTFGGQSLPYTHTNHHSPLAVSPSFWLAHSNPFSEQFIQFTQFSRSHLAQSKQSHTVQNSLIQSPTVPKHFRIFQNISYSRWIFEPWVTNININDISHFSFLASL